MGIGYCGSCGTVLLTGTPREQVGERTFCAPAGSACHDLGLRSVGWTLTAAEAKALLHADVSAAQPQQARAA